MLLKPISKSGGQVVYNLADRFRVKTVIQQYSGKQLSWGTTDCVTFFFETQAALHLIDTKHYWQHKYNDIKTAVQWSKHNPFEQCELLKQYEQLEVSSSQLELGDAKINYKSSLPHSQIYYDNLWWSVWDGLGFGHNIVSNTETHLVWRRKCPQQQQQS